MSPQKRIQHLRSKNKLLLEKLESHSSQIEAEIKYLKKKLRGTAAKFTSGNDRSKNWSKRSSPRQVNEELSSCAEPATDYSALQKHAVDSRDVNSKGRSSNLGCDRKNLCKNSKIDAKEDSVGPSEKTKPSPCRRLKSVRNRSSTVESSINYRKSIRDIISLIDYSPKSTFLKRMKSKFEPYTSEFYVRVKQEIGDLDQKAQEEKGSKDKKGGRHARDVGNTPCDKHFMELKTEEDPKISLRSSLCCECGKRIERNPITNSDESVSSMEKECCKHTGVTMENELERLKNFRAKNWQDCHAIIPRCETLHCCGHRECGAEMYGINERLLAAPLAGHGGSVAHCPPCGGSKSKHSCCAHPKKVLVTIPTTLIDGDALDASRGRRVKRMAPNCDKVLKKLQRPVPQNSMALRYQKGIGSLR
ncbi:uncharacterized protein LOC124156630 [Ischnura elegans]|uniref:uncharacterized protein LOC124156630 n=1 Tax=Ischnura elegans TaxID=197161 RepID=UPI001ED895AF|nr:uncharacterized protein LOC124156630 [Ischnura elegans]